MALEAARHLCQEARGVLSSLRGGPPMVARGDLAHDLIDLRSLIKHTLNLERPAETPGSPEGSVSPPQIPENVPPPASSFEPNTNLDPPPPMDVGPFAKPFLAVVMDPRAAGPHTLVALRSLHRLLEYDSLLVASAHSDHPFTVALEPLTKGVLNCKFEQTDAGADEAVEMAIADLLALIVQRDRRSLKPETLMDAFNTVFVTRNTFVHSPALCYHFEDVLISMCNTLFGDLDSLQDPAGRLVLEFLVNQLLHTPLVGGMDEASREAQMAHDATRILCLRLSRTALKAAFEENFWTNEDLTEAATGVLAVESGGQSPDVEERSVLQIVQDEFCLSLLMTGQATWSNQDSNNFIMPGLISLEVLSEICSTLSTLWTTNSLRNHLVSQFEAIFTGFYQRALVLLRKRNNPTDSMTFHSNMYFDAGCEIILESLVDIMTIHDHKETVAEGNGGSLETLFALYDCNIKRSDVAVGLMVDLCRCTGSKVNEEGEIFDLSVHGDELTTPRNTGSTPTPSESFSADLKTSTSTLEEDTFIPSNDALTEEGYRQVPPHLRELCAEAIIGGMKCLFRDDHPSEETIEERHNRQSILAGHVSPAPKSWSDLNRVTSSHHLRNLKSKKRLMRRAAQLFNKKASHGIEFLLRAGVIEEPVSPRAVASFLRNAIVVGLDKKAVGMYLGEVGKSPEAGKSPPVWQRDWFHKEVLESYCSLFRFEKQSLLDGLRMFLAAFRLPGEAQQIDRILQAFSDTCSRVCNEGMTSSLKLFSEDPKRASDAAYLLSFSIIMLNTDQHNDNIREDRKMSKDDFVKNNTDYGRDITEKGKELPREYLEGIYDSIREEEIRTEGEGADGCMTVERWKDVLRGSSEEDYPADELPSAHDAEDLTELVLEHVWMPIMSSISALWGANVNGGRLESVTEKQAPPGQTGMLGAQGARLGMDMAWDMLVGVRQLGRDDLFRKIFNCICKYSGLLDYKSDISSRSWAFANSVEAQGAFVVALHMAREATDAIGVEGWKRVWLMLFELRDLKMLGGGINSRGKSLLMETEADLLREDHRRDWTMKLMKRGEALDDSNKKKSGVSSVFGAMGRALFGSSEDPSASDAANESSGKHRDTVHGKERLVVWDDIAPSDDEDEVDGSYDDADGRYSPQSDSRLTLGSKFETLLIQENLVLTRQRETPVTGLEKVDDSNGVHSSSRARVRKRLSKNCDFAGLITDSRFMDAKTIGTVLESLIALVPVESIEMNHGSASSLSIEKDNSSNEFSARLSHFPISPASEAFAEILIAEIALRNRDRMSDLWQEHLKAHYSARLRSILLCYTENERSHWKVLSGSMEKSISGLLRISSCAVQRGDVCNDVLETWTVLDEVDDGDAKKSMADVFDRHLSEGLWRITRGIDGSSVLAARGWNGIFALAKWCANRGCRLPPIRVESIGKTVGLSEDDPSLQVYRSLHFLLNVSEVKNCVPSKAAMCIRTLVATGEIRRCPKLCIAALDLFRALCHIVEVASENTADGEEEDQARLYWEKHWLPILDGIAEASCSCSESSVRQHALSVLTDVFLERQGGRVPVPLVRRALSGICIPLSGRKLVESRSEEQSSGYDDEAIAEIELCIDLLFKPLRRHIENFIGEGSDAFVSVWGPFLDIVKDILNTGNEDSGRALVLEQLRNVVMVLINYDALNAESTEGDELSTITWAAVSNMKGCGHYLKEWKAAASQSNQ